MEDRSSRKKTLRRRKLLYFSGQISFTLSLIFPSVFQSNAFQNIIHKHVTIFLTQQPFVLRLVFPYKSRDFAYLCDFVTNFGYPVTQVLVA